MKGWRGRGGEEGAKRWGGARVGRGWGGVIALLYRCREILGCRPLSVYLSISPSFIFRLRFVLFCVTRFIGWVVTANRPASSGALSSRVVARKVWDVEGVGGGEGCILAVLS